VLWIVLAAGLAVCISGCSENPLRIHLRAESMPEGDVRRLGIEAQITGRPDGLTYHWFSVSGECDPQESPAPSTVFRFGDGTSRDRVTVEAWRGDVRVARSEVDVVLDAARAWQQSEPLPSVQIAITTIPPYEPEGGPDTRADIAGRVSGEILPDYRVVIYARADVWYVQPLPRSSHPIRTDSTWAGWTHTGASYAALVVRPGFEPIPRVDVLPQVGGYVVARAVVVGTRR
jgi:hypothetical protein